jgi:hypothetical protein
MRRALIAAAVLTYLLPLPGRAQEAALTQPGCFISQPTQSEFASFPLNVLENLAFDGSHLWISNSTAGRIDRFAADGTPSGSIAVPSPAAITPHNGLLYVNSGNGAPGSLLRTGQSKVLTFDPATFDPNGPAPTLNTYTSGFSMANGAAFDGGGNLWVSNDFDSALLKIAPGGSPVTGYPVYGTNGLVVVGDDLYAAVTFDQRSPIEKISVADGTYSTFVQLSLGVLSLKPAVHGDPDSGAPLLGVKGLDDMTLGPDGRLYVVANGTGELIRVDLDGTPDACLVASGLRNPSSVRFAPPEFAPWSGDAFVTEFSGRLVRIDL